MVESLCILILEDNPADAELAQYELEGAGLAFTSKVVTCEKDFVLELRESCPDLILSDYDLPQYNGALALAEAGRRCPDTPFILMTGAIGEDRAIEILTQGAKDYVLKHRLKQRLVPAVLRALAEAEEQRARKQAEAELHEAHRTIEERVKIRTAELEAEMTARKKAEGALRKSEERYRLAIKAANDAICDVDLTMGTVHCNETYAAAFERPPENGHSWQWWIERIHPEDREHTVEGLLSALDGLGADWTSEYRFLRTDGMWANIFDRGYIERDESGKACRVVFAMIDLTERKRAEQALAEQAAKLKIANKKLTTLSHSLKKASEELEARVMERTAALNEATQRLQLAVASGRIGIWDRDIQSGAMVWDDMMFDIYGLSKESFTPAFDAWQRYLHPDDCDRVMEANRAAIAGEQEFDIEFRILLPDGTVKWVHADSRVTRDSDGKPLHILGINRDISKRKIAEIKLQASLREKETLLKEIHHRVKNNLQVISSMLSMQAGNVRNEIVQNILIASQNRIRTMAGVHSMLYKSTNFAEVDFGVYVQDMVKQLINSYGIKPGAVSASISAENVLLSIETAVPCSLIINELVSNTLKHAFPDGRQGEIKIELTQVDGDIRIILEDNGIGFPENIDFRNTNTLGLDLVNLLIEQLGGTIELLRNGGTKYVITLTVQEPRKELYVDRRKNDGSSERIIDQSTSRSSFEGLSTPGNIHSLYP